MNGQPCIRGVPLTVKRALETLALYPVRAELFAEFPELKPEDIRQALAFAAGSRADAIAPLKSA